jgi:ribonuclease P protein component
MTSVPSAIQRLTVRREFLYTAKGRKAVKAGLVLQARRRDDSVRSDEEHCGAGFTATRKIGNAVVRNRAKRRLKSAVRLLLPLHGRPGYNYVFIARASTPDRDWLLLLDDVKTALMSIAAGNSSNTVKIQA